MASARPPARPGATGPWRMIEGMGEDGGLDFWGHPVEKYPLRSGRRSVARSAP